jgi:cellobiose phosphorylase
MGNGSRALKYYLESCPAAQNADVETRKCEPYVYCQFTESDNSPNHGKTHVHWLTGTASTVMVSAVEGILGLRPNIDGLTLQPAFPPEWGGFTMTKKFRGKTLNIEVKCTGSKKLVLNGKQLDGNFIPANEMKDVNEVLLEV